jgi:hypothetical protein
MPTPYVRGAAVGPDEGPAVGVGLVVLVGEPDGEAEGELPGDDGVVGRVVRGLDVAVGVVGRTVGADVDGFAVGRVTVLTGGRVVVPPPGAPDLDVAPLVGAVGSSGRPGRVLSVVRLCPPPALAPPPAWCAGPARASPACRVSARPTGKATIIDAFLTPSDRNLRGMSTPRPLR